MGVWNCTFNFQILTRAVACSLMLMPLITAPLAIFCKRFVDIELASRGISGKQAMPFSPTLYLPHGAFISI
ncbi:hypothetical protein B0O99DRAFT_626414 [Bisporella sp. PMI_857]|nr:hypothetical protein B0O99DRAFT_626414 [Bisporella sp. PMI_857]